MSAHQPSDPDAPRLVPKSHRKDIGEVYRSLVKSLDDSVPVTPATIYPACGTSAGACTLKLGTHDVRHKGWIPRSSYRIAIMPGFEVVASDGKSDQLWVGPVVDCPNHTNFKPHTFTARKSSPASDVRRNKLPMYRVTERDMHEAREAGAISELSERALQFYSDENSALRSAYMHTTGRVYQTVP